MCFTIENMPILSSLLNRCNIFEEKCVYAPFSTLFSYDTKGDVYMRYNRKNAVDYALKWALKRNPVYYNFDNLGGDCTNFISQCLYAGIPQMNFSQRGWYYINGNKKSPSWTGVNFLYDFLIHNQQEGPRGIEIEKSELQIGDVIQLSFINNIFGHSLIVTSIENNIIKVCSHTVNSLNRPLDTYIYEVARYIKIH